MPKQVRLRKQDPDRVKHDVVNELVCVPDITIRISGEAGTGKTTLAATFGYWLGVMGFSVQDSEGDGPWLDEIKDFDMPLVEYEELRDLMDGTGKVVRITDH